MTRCTNIHSDWIARTTAALLSWGYLPVVFAERVNIILQSQHMIFQPITFGLIVPDVAAKIMRQ